MYMYNNETRVLKSFFLLCLLFYKIQGKCKTTFITKCDKSSDIPRYGKQTWKNLIIANDECSKEVFGAPNEVLKTQIFNNAKNIEEMYIVEKLIEIQPGAFNGLEKLTYLKLYKNILKVIPRGAFGNITQLLKLDLQNNSIENIQHGLFENSSISFIDLSYNKLNNIQVDMLALPSLKKLVITYNNMEQLVPNCFHENLEYLNLDHNNLKVINEEVMIPLKNLKELILSNNKLDGIAVHYGLESLEKLDLSHNQIKGIEEKSFRGFSELKVLLLGYNQLTYINPNLFSEENIIEVLHVHQNRLMNLDSRLGTNLPNLKEMSIGGNPWACPCLAKITAYFGEKKIQQPDCEKKFFTEGISAVCWVTIDDKCTGKEELTLDVAAEFKQALRYYNC